jgi:hypothetical protein
MPSLPSTLDLTSLTTNQLDQLSRSLESPNLISGNPGTWSLHPIHPAFMAAMSGTPAGALQLNTTQTGIALTALNQSNAAALTTPSAASGTPTTADTSVSTITSLVNGILGGIDGVGRIPNEIKTLEQGTKATLHPWGWSANMDEDATTALEDLLSNGTTGIATILTALAPISAPLAAVAAILKLAASAIDELIEKADHGKGVTIDGVLWLYPRVTGN